MLRYLVSALFLLSSPGFFFAAAGSPPAVAAWWASATSAYGASSDYVASRTVLRIDELDAKGVVTSYERGETRLDWSGVKPEVVVVRAEKNGKDVSDEWRKRYAKSRSESKSGADGSSGGAMAGFDATPFDPKYASALSLGEPRAADGVIEVPYTIATSSGPVDGIASFLTTGEVVAAVQSWRKPPGFVESVRSSIRYAYHEGALVVASMEIDSEALVLFVKRHFRMSFEFSEWKRSPR